MTRPGIEPRIALSPEDQGSIPGCVIPKTQKMVLDVTLLNTQYYKVWIKGKVEQSKECSSTLPYALVQQLLKREPSGSPLTMVAKLYLDLAKWAFFVSKNI